MFSFGALVSYSMLQATDSLMDKLKLKPVNPHRLKNNNTAAISAN